MVKPADLAGRADFRAGPLLVSPARRRIEGPAGHVQVEPLTMQVFLLLLDSCGQVVTREALFEAGWGEAMVGDDSLNRAINRVRRIDLEIGPGVFEVETVPRTGYRLVGDLRTSDGAAEAGAGQGVIPRRTLIVGGAAAAAAAAGFAFWSRTSRKDQEYDALLSRGQEALDYSDPAIDAKQYFRKAVALRPDDARALGLYSYAVSLRTDRARSTLREGQQINDSGQALLDATHMAKAALALDPADPNARLALVIAQQSALDLPATEDRLQEILKTAPDNVSVMRNLWNLLQCVGRSRDALRLVDRSLEVVPLAAGSHYPKAQLLWITGRTAEADRVIARALDYWPSHRFVRFARFIILAFTGRARAALAMLEKDETRPQGFSPQAVELWRPTLIALDGGSAIAIDEARRANRSQAMSNLELCRQAAMSLCALGDVDGAFEVASALFATSATQSSRTRSQVSSTAWRFAPWMFIPATAPMRADPRFAALCDGIGLTEYWKLRRVRPDYQLDSA